MRTTFRSWRGAALVGLALLTAACGAESPQRDLGESAAATEARGTARTEVVTRFTGAGPAASHEFRTSGVVDYANRRREDTEATTGCRTIAIGDVVYSELPESDDFGSGKRWIRADGNAEEDFEASQREIASSDGRSGVLLLFATGPEPTPDEYLEHLPEISGDVVPVGRETVDGVFAMRYRATVDVRQRTRRELEAAGWKPENVTRYLETLVDGTEEVDVWVDPDGLVRRIETRTSWDAQERFGADEAITTMRFFDFGVQANIEPPPPDEVMDDEEWLRAVQAEQERELRELSERVPEEVEAAPPLPGGFVPPALSDDPEPPPSCLH